MAGGRRTAGARGLDIGLLLDRDRGRSHQPRDVGHQRHGDGDDQRGDARIQDAGDDDRQQNQGEGEEDIEDAHHDLVHPAPDIAGEQAEKHSDAGGGEGRHHADQERHPPAPEKAREHVAAVHVAAEEEAVGPRQPAASADRLGRVVRADIGRENGDQHHDREEDQRADRRLVLGVGVPGEPERPRHDVEVLAPELGRGPLPHRLAVKTRRLGHRERTPSEMRIFGSV